MEAGIFVIRRAWSFVEKLSLSKTRPRVGIVVHNMFFFRREANLSTGVALLKFNRLLLVYVDASKTGAGAFLA